MAAPFLTSIRESLAKLCGENPELLFALRRKIAKELGYDERKKPSHRKKLKREQRVKQGGLCKLCGEELPERGAVLDRLNAMNGYTAENTRLLCPTCDARLQQERGYK